MVKPSVMQPRPALLLLLLAGATATILITALLYLAPAFGLPLVDLPLLVGGIFSEDRDVALGLGYAIFFLSGTFLIPFLLGVAWSRLPGDPVTFPGAVLKGLLFSIGFFILSGLTIWVLGWLNQIDALEVGGPFALNQGLTAALILLLGHLVYGVAAGLVAAMGRNISPIDVVGWDGYQHGLKPPVGREAVKVFGGNGAHGYKAVGKEYAAPGE
ncbi:MAG: hypothetical protein R3272_16130 [Candidatus Promineifilaceae bacterium]|nr:hypothetical protein [Candidatus Promineifilaceae bacterium]